QANGVALNQQSLYTAKDAITGCWSHENGVTGEATWNFACDRKEDLVEIYGSEGKITFSIFGEDDIVLDNKKGPQKQFIEHPRHVQQFHVENLKEHLLGEKKHPSTGKTALHTSWIMDSILGNL
ncbi:MAG: gfo/Idh/MocA family oxidoreductase, partial [Aurantibacter sp.]